MNKADVIKLLTVIEATYPSFKVNDRRSFVEAWTAILEPYNSDAIGNALVIYTRTNPSKYAPSPAELIGLANKVDDNQIGIEERVSHIRKAVSRSSYFAKEEFEALDRIEQRAVGSPDNLRAWSILDIDEFESVVLSHVRKSLGRAEQDELLLSAMPSGKRSLMDKTKSILEEKLSKGADYEVR